MYLGYDDNKNIKKLTYREKEVFALRTNGCNVYSGWKWSSNSATYNYNPNLPSTWQTQVYNAAGTWNGNSNFSFYYNSSSSNAYGASDWGPSGSVGITRCYHTGSRIDYVYSDFNTYFPFSSNPPSGSYSYDLRSVALHEFGHWLALDDLIDVSNYSNVMYHEIAPEQIKRTLTSADISGIRSIYGY